MISWWCVCASWTMITWKDPTMLLVTSPLFGPAFQLKIEKSLWPLSSLLFLSVRIPSNGLASFICLYLGCRRFSAFAVSSVRHPTTSRILVSSIRRSGRPEGTPNGSHPSSSVSSDSHDSLGRPPRISFFGNCSSSRVREGQSSKHFFIFS